MTTKVGPGQLIFPVIGAPPEVVGFDQPVDTPDPAEQGLVDRVADKLQSLYEGLPDDKRPLLEAILSQAAAYAWSQSA